MGGIIWCEMQNWKIWEWDKERSRKISEKQEWHLFPSKPSGTRRVRKKTATSSHTCILPTTLPNTQHPFTFSLASWLLPSDSSKTTKKKWENSKPSDTSKVIFFKKTSGVIHFLWRWSYCIITKGFSSPQQGIEFSNFSNLKDKCWGRVRGFLV